jgi:hypothetical protein
MKYDGPSFETPGIFCETAGLVHLGGRDCLIPVVTNISKYPNNLLCTILKATEDDGPSFKRSEIFCEAASLVHLEVRGWSGSGGPTLKIT